MLQNAAFDVAEVGTNPAFGGKGLVFFECRKLESKRRFFDQGQHFGVAFRYELGKIIKKRFRVGCGFHVVKIFILHKIFDEGSENLIFTKNKTMKNQWLACLLFLSCSLIAQEKKAYQLYDKNGKKTDYGKLLKSATNTQVVLFGEFHNNAICHWLQLELTRDLAQTKPLVLGAEMIEADNQKQLDQYLSGEINQKKLDSTARLWKNHRTDYKPLVDFAKDRKIPFIATNIPRRYASKVAQGGFEVLAPLTEEEKSWIAPQPILYDENLPGYVAMKAMMGDHGSPNMMKAQAVKDATMGYFIHKNLREDSVFIHYNGSYHSDNFDGINWYLQKYHPGIKILTISTVEQKEVTKLEKENYNKADYILVIDEDVTKTH